MSYRLCRWFGHRREYYPVQRMCLSRRGYWQMRTLTWVRCKRCGIGREAYEPGIIEAWRDRIRDGWRRLVTAVEACKEDQDRFNDGLPF
jgi:hypothetical protein